MDDSPATDEFESHDAFIHAVQQWVVYDNYLTQLDEKRAPIARARQELTRKICQYNAAHEFRYPSIGISDGTLFLDARREYEPLSIGYIHHCLERLVKNADHVERIVQILKDNRGATVVPEIRRTGREGTAAATINGEPSLTPPAVGAAPLPPPRARVQFET